MKLYTPFNSTFITLTHILIFFIIKQSKGSLQLVLHTWVKLAHYQNLKMLAKKSVDWIFLKYTIRGLSLPI